MKCSLGISNFLEDISSLFHSIVFLCFFALITEEGFLISPCYPLELCIQMGIFFIFWVSLPYCSPPGCPFPIKSLALLADVSPLTIHFQVLDKSPVLGPGRGPSSFNKWRLWLRLFFAETDILTTRGTQGPACLPMDQTQRPQLGPFCPWSPPDADSWPECPDQ